MCVRVCLSRPKKRFICQPNFTTWGTKVWGEKGRTGVEHEKRLQLLVLTLGFLCLPVVSLNMVQKTCWFVYPPVFAQESPDELFPSQF